eukprot:TRINITY_DN4363_c0_g1_i1.p1 TRINITY_DN4363_c0_g1~~TRINITY_DN4363_c0_g1_i1.p1  ORF type:complete len:1062 (-),score=298.27 TRINITY_DN4363_c0_g1_i1:84-3269(-)
MEHPTGIESAEQLEVVLQHCLVPDSDIIHQAEAILHPFLRQSQCVVALLEQIRGSSDPGVRQLAAVLLRSRVAKLWSKVSREERGYICETLLNVIVNDPVHPVRYCIAGAISSVARFMLPSGQWPELLPFVFECARAEDDSYRWIGVKLLNSLQISMRSFLSNNFDRVFEIIQSGLVDKSSDVQAASIRFLSSVVDSMEEEELSHILPIAVHLPNATISLLEEGEEETAVIAMEILTEFAGYNISKANVVSWVRTHIEIASNGTLDITTRERALDLIAKVSSLRPAWIHRNNLIRPIVLVCFTLMREPSVDVFHDSVSSRYGTHCLHQTSSHLPNKYVFPVLYNTCMSSIRAEDIFTRIASLSGLGIAAETCQEEMCDHIADAVQAVVESFGHPDPQVKEAACFAMAQYAEYLQPDVLNFHEAVLPSLIPVLGTAASPMVQTKGCLVLDAFVENLENDVLPYLDLIMKNLVPLLDSPVTEVVASVFSAIAAVAVASREQFSPYVGYVLDVCEHGMTLSEDDSLIIRARATECLGNVLDAAGISNVPEDRLGRLIELVFSGFDLGFSELNEYSYGFFINLASQLGEGMEPFMERIVSLALAACRSNDKLVATFAATDDPLETDNALDQIEDEEDGGDDDDGEGNVDDGEDSFPGINMRISRAAADEKAAAVHVLGELARSCGAAFLPYVQETSDTVLQLVKHTHPSVRQNIPEVLQRLFDVIVSTEHRPESFLEVYAAIVVHYMTAEEDKEIAAAACVALGKMALVSPRDAFDPMIPRIIEAISLILLKQTPSQVQYEDEDEDEEDFDHILTDAVSDCCIDLFKALRSDFVPYFAELFPMWLRYWAPDRTDGDRTTACGVFAEALFAMQEHAEPFAENFLEIACEGIASDSSFIQRNGAFLLGGLFQYFPALSLPRADSLIPQLAGLLMEKATPVVVDNASAAIARWVIAASNARVDRNIIAGVLPVWLDSLPPQGDLEEIAVLLQCLGVVPAIASKTSRAEEIISLLLVAMSQLRQVINTEEQLALLSSTKLAVLESFSHDSLQNAFNTVGEEAKNVFESL